VGARDLAIVGLGKMGRAVAELAPQHGWDVCATIDSSANHDGSGITAKTLNGAAVAIEFTEPAAAVANAIACVRAGCPVVVGTTGWYDQLAKVTKEVGQRSGAMLWAPNFAMGVGVFVELARAAGTMFAGTDFDAHIVETHHVAKKDAPSGTAGILRDSISEGLGRPVPITSIRTGSVPGTHELVFDSQFEQLTLTHTARDRRVFAAGALAAAEWLIGKKGVFTMRDMLASART
jgi:4-hydroxy-tetrahydrodipicolinate reductase